MRNTILAFVLFFIYCLSVSAGNSKNDYVLVLNSVTFQGIWADFYQYMESECIRLKIDIKNEELSVPLLKTIEETDNLRDKLIAKYTQKPKAVVFIGDPGWIVCSPIFDHVWKDIPVLVCFSESRVPADLQDLLDKTILTDENSIPISEFNKRYNVTTLTRNFFIEETIGMMRDIIPGIKKIAFISDSRYISMIAREKMKRTMQDKFPFLELDLLTYDSLGTQQLIDTISAYDRSVGIIYYSWYTFIKGSGQPYMSDNLKKVIGIFSCTPVFTLSETDTKSGFFAGGYYVPIADFAEKTVVCLRRILSGERASDIPSVTVGEPVIALNYENLKEHGIDPVDFPENAVYFQKPLTFYEKYRSYIYVFAIILILFLIFCYFYRELRKEHKAQVKKYTDHCRRLIDRMPMFYVRKRILVDECGNVEDCILLGVNKAFETIFGYPIKYFVGKRVSELCKVGFPFSWICEKNVLDKVSSFSYSDKQTGKVFHYDIVSFRGDSDDIIEMFCTDRTERHEAEIEAKKVTYLNQRIINSICEPVYWIEGDGFIGKILNDRENFSFVIPVDCLEGRNIREFLSEDEYLNHISLLKKVLRTKETEQQLVHFEYEGVKELSFIVRMVYFDTDKVLSFVQNVSEMEKARLESERARYVIESIIDNLPIPTTVKDLNDNGKYLFWNKEAEKLFGCSAEILIGNTADLLPNNFLSKEFERQDVLVAAGKYENPYLSKVILNDGKEYFFLFNKKEVSYSDGKRWMVSSVIDFTELQRSKQMLENVNQRYELVLRAVRLTPWTWDLEKDEICCDIRYAPFWTEDMKPELVVSGEQYYKQIDKEDVERIKNAFRDLYDGKAESVREEYRVLQLPEHDERSWTETYAVVGKRDKSGKPIMFVGASLSINDRKELEYDLRDAKDKAEESNRLKSAFLANMSHEIRTPLNAIVGFSGILPYAENEQERREYIKIIENNNVLLLQLVNDILDISKIEAGMMSFSYSNVDLNRVMEEVEQSSRMRIKSGQVRLSFDECLPQCVFRTDSNRLIQVLTNLITNAIKFTKEGCISIGYRLKNESTLYFYVRDTGCGIDPDKRKKIFRRFVKLNDFVQGTGLGLSISEMIVSRLGGEIGVMSEVGRGSEFWFTLPYIEPVYANLNICKPVRCSEDIKKQGKLVILIAEDDSSNYRLFETVFKKDYALVHAWNGQEAVIFCKEQMPDFILMDIKMPVMDGYEAVSEIRKISDTVPIIAVTAFAFADDEQRIMESGFDDYVTKPVNAFVLKDKIEELLNR